MSYDIYLCKFDAPKQATWANFEALGDTWDADIDDWSPYAPNAVELALLEKINEAIHAACDEEPGFDIGYEEKHVIGVNINYWAETEPSLPKIVEILNDLSDELGPQWLWADPQTEQVSKHVNIEALIENFSFLLDPPRKSFKQHVIDWSLMIGIAGLTFWGLHWWDNGGACKSFEVPGTEPGTCTVPCLENETPEACDKRAHQLLKDAGLEADVVTQ